eukprot:1987994-Amphidinium_carterae.2
MLCPIECLAKFTRLHSLHGSNLNNAMPSDRHAARNPVRRDRPGKLNRTRPPLRRQLDVSISLSRS